jgi:hypothetical protein
VLHSKVPAEVVDKTELLLQLFTTVTTGVEGVLKGEAPPTPCELVQPFTVTVTPYTAEVLTVMTDVVSPSLHSHAPVETVDKVDVLLQLLTTVTTGLAGGVLGLATAVAAALVHPFEAVWVTLYVPAVPTRIELWVDPPGSHFRVPV